MKLLAKLASAFALAGTLVPALLFFMDLADLEQVKTWMLIAAVGWFVATPVCRSRPGRGPVSRRGTGQFSGCVMRRGMERSAFDALSA